MRTFDEKGGEVFERREREKRTAKDLAKHGVVSMVVKRWCGRNGGETVSKRILVVLLLLLKE